MSATRMKESNGCGGFTVGIEGASAADGEQRGAARIVCKSNSSNGLTAAGVAAVVARINTYYTAAKVRSIRRMSPEAESPNAPLFSVQRGQIILTVLPADAETQADNLITDLRVAANVDVGNP